MSFSWHYQLLVLVPQKLVLSLSVKVCLQDLELVHAGVAIKVGWAGHNAPEQYIGNHNGALNMHHNAPHHYIGNHNGEVYMYHNAQT